MPVNIELKARIRDLGAIRCRIGPLSDAACEVIAQEDVYFRVTEGRLKLRILAPDRGQLIFYTRPDQADPKPSVYRIAEICDPEGVRETLAMAYGVRGVVKKMRHLYRVGQTRIHLDRVATLGPFLELEVVLHPGQTEAEGCQIAEKLLGVLGIDKCDLCEVSYIDLIESARCGQYPTMLPLPSVNG